MNYLSFEEFEDLSEMVLIPSKKLISQILEVLKIFRNYMLKNNFKFLKDDQKVTKNLNRFLKTNDLPFVNFEVVSVPAKDLPAKYKKLYLVGANQEPTVTNIFVNKGFWKTFFEFTDIKFEEFISLVGEFLDHEFVHDAQNQQITLHSGEHEGVGLNSEESVDRKKYLSNPFEIMAHARDCSNQLIRVFGKIKAIEILKNPVKHKRSLPAEFILNDYIELFKNSDSVYKKFIKYTVEYIEKTQ